MYVGIDVCLSICVCVCKKEACTAIALGVYVGMHAWIYSCMRVYKNTCVYLCTHISSYPHMCICVNVCRDICMYVCIYTHIHGDLRMNPQRLDLTRVALVANIIVVVCACLCV